MSNKNLTALSEAGVAVWLDDLSRDRLSTGDLQQLVDDYSVVGVTTNPTIFQTAISKSSAYDEQVGTLAKQGMDAGQVIRELTTDDVRNAADLLAPVSERTSGIDGRVSIEVDPRAAHQREETESQARDLWSKVGRPNVFIKIPATLEGLPAITTAISEGISVNVTLIFGIERYQAVMDAYATGLERRVEAGQSLEGITSVASFFVSRVDSEVDKRLDKLGTDEAKALKGKAAVANARLAYGAFLQFTQSQRWLKLAAQGAHPQRPLWASTGVKNPDYSDTLYVTELVAAGTVNTMPEATLKAIADHGEVTGDTITAHLQDAQHTTAQLQQVGIDLSEVTKLLEVEGVEKFEVSWNDLLKTVEAAIEENK